jgi:hypothetical protein
MRLRVKFLLSMSSNMQERLIEASLRLRVNQSEFIRQAIEDRLARVSTDAAGDQTQDCGAPRSGAWWTGW